MTRPFHCSIWNTGYRTCEKSDVHYDMSCTSYTPTDSPGYGECNLVNAVRHEHRIFCSRPRIHGGLVWEFETTPLTLLTSVWFMKMSEDILLFYIPLVMIRQIKLWSRCSKNFSTVRIIMANAKATTKDILGFEAKDIDGNNVSLAKYKGFVSLIVNVASKWGFTNVNYTQLQELHKK